LSACAPSPQWSKRSSIPTSACTTRERYICGAALVCLRACTAGRRRGQNAVRADRSYMPMQRFVRYGACWTCYHLLSTDLLAERKVVVASSMK
jgi:hypothetical protein